MTRRSIPPCGLTPSPERLDPARSRCRGCLAVACPVRAGARSPLTRAGGAARERRVGSGLHPHRPPGGTVLGSFRAEDVAPSCLRSVPPGAAAGLPLASFRSRAAPPQDRSWRGEHGRRLGRRSGGARAEPSGPCGSRRLLSRGDQALAGWCHRRKRRPTERAFLRVMGSAPPASSLRVDRRDATRQSTPTPSV